MQRQRTAATLDRSSPGRYTARVDESDPEFVVIRKDGAIVMARSWTYNDLFLFVRCIHRLGGEVRNGEEAVERLWLYEHALKEAS